MTWVWKCSHGAYGPLCHDCTILGPHETEAPGPTAGRSVIHFPWGYYEVDFDTGEVIRMVPRHARRVVWHWRPGDEGSAGAREPRRPFPTLGSGSAELPEPGDGSGECL